MRKMFLIKCRDVPMSPIKLYAKVLIAQMLISHYATIVNSKLRAINGEPIDNVDQRKDRL